MHEKVTREDACLRRRYVLLISPMLISMTGLLGTGMISAPKAALFKDFRFKGTWIRLQSKTQSIFDLFNVYNWLRRCNEATQSLEDILPHLIILNRYRIHIQILKQA